MARLETRAGLIPEQENPEFLVTTQDVERYFNRELSQITNGHVQCEVASAEMGNRTYRPFMVALPSDVIIKNKNDKGGNRGNGTSLISLSEEKNKTNVRINGAVYSFFKNYMYNKRALDDSWRHMYGFSRQDAEMFRSLVSPKRFYRNSNDKNRKREEVVIIALDPLIVLWDVVGSTTSNDPYCIDVTNVKKIAKGQYEYTVIRKLASRTSSVNKSLIDDLNLYLNPYRRDRR